MSKTFPQLLARSRFASYDPAISRVYTAPHRNVTRGDFGFKFPIFRPSNARFLEMRQLDGGPGLRADWRSAEKEARFVAQWGDGRTPWRSPSTSRRHVVKNPLLAETSATEEVTELMPNVDAMTNSEFERYLAGLRRRRAQFQEAIKASLPEGTETLAEASARGAVREQAITGFQADLLKQQVEAPGSTRVMAKPHKIGGLAYSAAPAAGASLDPQRVHVGRVLDQAPRGAGSFRGIDGVNAEWVVGLGGITATGNSGTVRVTDRPTLSKFDYTRERKHAGLARFAVREAALHRPPRVLGTNQRANVEPFTNRSTEARRIQPFDSMRFEVRVREMEPERPGEAEWVARDTKATAAVGAGGLGLLGGNRKERSASESHQAARRINSKIQGDTIDSILARIIQNDSK
ncbi:hypothetical protein A1Q2_00591 [Trichosporon asahii var. asahii CBS 8904]|uniref:Uncharacterized protein n=2 Tax=Trichosporon asahii var. asahii TaxID=189963 RepID=K1VLV3_TRIAC|nr:hypothetical protein A1Q1_03784 [Trichosporon asahii var. asahii CBS 2479]EJT52503.1 hypothetical protein A1Q1_03784 [Trichosporon asahii var. asahii CBS 2479]EKD05125.1 hypothetical protein A1Q2_00591 [Trichosporon asahii var. asahii CBS 8904]